MGCNISMVLKEYRNGSYLILNTVTIPFQLCYPILAIYGNYVYFPWKSMKKVYFHREILCFLLLYYEK